VRAARPVAAVICVWTIASSLEAATLVDLERALIDAVNVRARIAATRDQRVAEASVLADEIARLKTRAGSAARADAVLESRLQQLDRLSTGLDQADARMREQDGLIGQLRAAFDAEADAESRRVTEDRGADPRVVASRLSDVDERRRRVGQLTRMAPDFRPVLDIRVTLSDTVVDIDRKRAIVTAERERASAELGRLARELSVLDARETLKRRLLDTLESALSEAPAEMRVLRRQMDDLTQSLRDLNRQRQDLHALRRDVDRALAQLDQRQGELQARRLAIMARVPVGDAE
jgi:chromosome segregation ATPase